MEDSELRQKLDALERKIDTTFTAADKTRKYILVMLVVTTAAVVLPLIGLIFAIPTFLSTYGSIGGL